MRAENKKEKFDRTIEIRKQKQQQILCEQLKKIPIIQIACSKAGIGRATYYRWLDDDVFAKNIKEATKEGIDQINDLAESGLINNIKNGNLRAIEFWLRNNKKSYKTILNPITTEQEKKLEEIRKSLEEFVDNSPNLPILKEAIRKNARRENN